MKRRAARWMGLLLGGMIVLAPSVADAQKSISDGVDELASKLATSFGGVKKGRVAIVPLRVLGGSENLLGSYIAETLTNSFFNVGYRDIVERHMLDRAIRELRLQVSGMIEPSSAKRIGRFVSADFVVGGTMTDLTGEVVVTCRMFATETGEIVAVAQTRLLKDDNVKRMMATTAEGGPGVSQPPPTDPAAVSKESPQRSRIVEPSPPTLNDYPWRFTVKRCSRMHGEERVECELLIENLSEGELRLLLNPMYYMGGRVSFLSDREGKQYGARVERGAVDNALNPVPEFLPHIPTSVRLYFDHVPEELKQVTLVVRADQGLLAASSRHRFPEWR